MNIPVVETAHIRLRPFSAADIDGLFLITNQENILLYFPNPDPWTREKTGRFIEEQLSHWEQHGFGWWGVERLDTPGLIGWNGLQYLPDTNEIEVGYLISKDYWGRGWTTEGAYASLYFGFETKHIDSIIAIVHPDNIASKRVALKCGMSCVDRNSYFGMDCFRYRIYMNEFELKKEAGL
jgi:RimJ/RimL family protein N-acetyltransferase